MSKARDLANAGTALTTVDTTELGYLDGVTSAVQTQIDSKEATLPSQTGNSGKYLTTDGTNKSWGTVSQYALPSQTGQSGKYLSTDGTSELWAEAAIATEIFNLTTTRKVIPLVTVASGDYTFITNTGTATVFLYNSSNVLMNQISVTTTSQTVAIASDILRAEAQGSTTNTVAILRLPTAVASTTTADISLVTANGAWSSYDAGQYAHVLLIGGGGGSGGGWDLRSGAGSGGVGSVAFNNTAIELNGSYTFTIGAGGTGGAAATNVQGTAGNAGSATNAFGLTANGGNGGQASTFNANGPSGTTSVSLPQDTQIAKQQGYSLLSERGAGGQGGNVTAGVSGTAGAVLIYKWTP
jgi:hypothetical protein